MEASVAEAKPQDGAPVEAAAEATRSTRHLFQHSTYVHAGVGAEECQHREDGKCRDSEHFHAWVVVPNSIQQGDIQEKARAAKARRRLAMRDTNSDAYAMVEADLDVIMAGPREVVLDSLAAQEANKKLAEVVAQVRELEEFEDYGQHREEWQRLVAMPEEERPTEDFEFTQGLVTRFAEEINSRLKAIQDGTVASLAAQTDEQIRDALRQSRVEQEGEEAARRTYYLWMGFVGTRRTSNHQVRVYDSLNEFKAAPPEAVEKIDAALEELESRLVRGDAQGN